LAYVKFPGEFRIAPVGKKIAIAYDVDNLEVGGPRKLR
jgi:hypothetical protein